MNNLIEEQHKDKLRQLIMSNKKVEAIKYIRSLTGFGLKESKDLCETFYNDLSKLDDFNLEIKVEEVITDPEFQKAELDENELHILKRMVERGEKLNAVKLVKERLKLALKEAKEFVDKLDDGTSTTKTVIFGDDESVMVELDVEEEESITFETLNDFEEDEAVPEAAEIFFKKEETVRKKPTVKKKESKAVSFSKIEKRDEFKKRNRSNSGCMLMFAIMFFSGVLIIRGIYIL